jgi:CheY-like chemotaxis protein
MKRRVLVVEDDAAISMALRDRLRSEGYSVECVGDGLAGFARAVGAAWDLLILDIMLPGKDGLEICRDIRAKSDKRIYSPLRRGDPRLRLASLHQPSCLGSRTRICSLTVRPRPHCPHAPHHFPVIVPATADG